MKKIIIYVLAISQLVLHAGAPRLARERAALKPTVPLRMRPAAVVALERIRTMRKRKQAHGNHVIGLLFDCDEHGRTVSRSVVEERLNGGYCEFIITHQEAVE